MSIVLLSPGEQPDDERHEYQQDDAIGHGTVVMAHAGLHDDGRGQNAGRAWQVAAEHLARADFRHDRAEASHIGHE